MAETGAGQFDLFFRRFWEDEDVLVLSTTAKLLFIWTWTQPTAPIGGLYRCTREEMANAIGVGWDLGTLDFHLMELQRKPLVLYDDQNEVIFVCRRAEYAARSERAIARMRAEYARAPASPLRDEFARMYGAFLDLPTLPPPTRGRAASPEPR